MSYKKYTKKIEQLQALKETISNIEVRLAINNKIKLIESNCASLKAEHAKNAKRVNTYLTLIKTKKESKSTMYTNRQEVKVGTRISCKQRKVAKNKECRQARMAAYT